MYNFRDYQKPKNLNQNNWPDVIQAHTNFTKKKVGDSKLNLSERERINLQPVKELYVIVFFSSTKT